MAAAATLERQENPPLGEVERPFPPLHHEGGGPGHLPGVLHEHRRQLAEQRRGSARLERDVLRRHARSPEEQHPDRETGP